MAWYLVACLVVSGLAGGSPWLHRWLEHGASDRIAGHVHRRGGRSGVGDRFFAAFQHAAPAARLAHAHAHDADHGHPEALPSATDPAAGRDPGPGSESSAHTHHGLPGLLAAGLVDVAGSTLPQAGTVLGAFAIRSVVVAGWKSVATLDRTQAARPPPRTTGHH